MGEVASFVLIFLHCNKKLSKLLISKKAQAPVRPPFGQKKNL
jgi:hypothetical protein